MPICHKGTGAESDQRGASGQTGGDLHHVTHWQVVGQLLGLVAYVTAWVRGGHPERLGAGVLLFVWLLSSFTYRWEVNGFYPAGMAQDCIRLLIFAWLAFRSDRWWPFLTAAALGLLALLYVARLLNPAFSHYAMASGHVGLGYLIDLSLLLGVWERRLSGEPPAARAAWAAAERATAARRNRGRPKNER